MFAAATKAQEIHEKYDEVKLKMTNKWTRFDDEFKKAAQKYQVSWEWLKAIALNESSLGEESSVARGLATPGDIEGSKSSDGLSWGLMQVTLKTAKQFDPLASPEKLNDPKYSIDMSARVISDNIRYFKIRLGDSNPRFFEMVIKAYNTGPLNAFNETKGIFTKWTPHVQEYWERFQRNLERVRNG